MALNLKFSNFDISGTRHNRDLIFSTLDRIRHVLSGVDLDIDLVCDHGGQGQGQGHKMTLTRDSAHAKCEGVYCHDSVVSLFACFIYIRSLLSFTIDFL